jgi:exopolyphosphatase/guanosine-5'-triphosphate,3'-diphosphate pyrophosphatase
MTSRYHVDIAQSARVSATAKMLLEQCISPWQLSVPLCAKAISWSAQLHEIGLDISHLGYHRHGAYIAENADMPGFPQAEQRLLAFLIGSQRHQIVPHSVDNLPDSWRSRALRLALILRLAVLLNRSRSNVELPVISMKVSDRSIDLRFDAAWLAENPLTVADLERERSLIRAVGYELNFR